MGRKRTRPTPNPSDGIARGVLQRAILSSLLAGDTLTVPITSRRRAYGPPSRMTAASWTAFQARLTAHGYRLVWSPDDYASCSFDTYCLERLITEPEPKSIV